VDGLKLKTHRGNTVGFLMGATPCGVALQGVFNASTDLVAAQWSGEGAGVFSLRSK
jgi:hypothetical protein